MSEAHDDGESASLTSVSGVGDDRTCARRSPPRGRSTRTSTSSSSPSSARSPCSPGWSSSSRSTSSSGRTTSSRRTRGCSRSSACRSRSLVGLLVKYRHAPTNLDESLLDSLSGDVTKIDWRTLPVNVVMAWASLFSGAVLGPEGGIGGIASKIAALYGEKVGDPGRAPLAARLLDARLGLQRARRQPAVHGRPRHGAHRGPGGEDPEPAGEPDRRLDRLPHLLRGGSSGLENYLHLSPDAGLRADRRRAGGALRAARAGARARRRRAVPGVGRGLRPVRGPRGRAGARSPGSSSASSASSRRSCCSRARRRSRRSSRTRRPTGRRSSWRWPS